MHRPVSVRVYIFDNNGRLVQVARWSKCLRVSVARMDTTCASKCLEWPPWISCLRPSLQTSPLLTLSVRRQVLARLFIMPCPMTLPFPDLFHGTVSSISVRSTGGVPQASFNAEVAVQITLPSVSNTQGLKVSDRITSSCCFTELLLRTYNLVSIDIFSSEKNVFELFYLVCTAFLAKYFRTGSTN